MSDHVSPAGEPPFDTVPMTADELQPTSATAAPARDRRPTVWLAALLIVVLVVGQCVAFALLFGDELERLSTPDRKVVLQGASGHEDTAATGNHAVEEPAPERRPTSAGPAARQPVHARHALDFGRESLAQGDLQSARVIAASFLLSLDGRADADKDRESEALALLGRVLALEYAEPLPERKR